MRLRLSDLALSRVGANLSARVATDDLTGKRVLVLVVEDLDRRIEESTSGRSVHVLRAPAFPVSCVAGAESNDVAMRVQLLVTAIKPVALREERRKNRPAKDIEVLDGVPPPSWYRADEKKFKK